MLIPSSVTFHQAATSSLSRRVNANSQLHDRVHHLMPKLIKKGEC